jgi:hypothetical protein
MSQMSQTIVENPRRTKTIRELGSVDISSIKDDIANLSQEYWDKYNRLKPNYFGEFETTQHIVFKFVSDYHQPFPDLVEFPVWEEWKNKLEPVMKAATELYGYSESAYGKVMLAKLKRGGKIGLHVDRPIESAYPHKIHIPITTNPDTKFLLDDQSYHLEVGKAYEVNNRTLHGGVNEGDSDRIHLIFAYYDRTMNEIKANDPELFAAQLRDQIKAAGMYKY